MIAVRDTYERVVGKWDGEIETYRTCLACAEIRKAMCCEGWTYTMLWEDFAESQAFGDFSTTGMSAKTYDCGGEGEAAGVTGAIGKD